MSSPFSNLWLNAVSQAGGCVEASLQALLLLLDHMKPIKGFGKLLSLLDPHLWIWGNN